MHELLPLASDKAAPQTLVMDTDGNISVKRGNTTKLVSIVKWNEAWRIFMSVALANPSLTGSQSTVLATDMLKYMHHINNLYNSGADWSFYDESFRRYAQFQEVPYSCVDYALAMEATNQAKGKITQQPTNTAMPRTTTPFMQNVTEARSRLSKYHVPLGYCMLYLANMQCQSVRCRYLHTCPWCTAPHPVSACKQPQFKNSPSTKTNGNVPGGRAIPSTAPPRPNFPQNFRAPQSVFRN